MECIDQAVQNAYTTRFCFKVKEVVFDPKALSRSFQVGSAVYMIASLAVGAYALVYDPTFLERRVCEVLCLSDDQVDKIVDGSICVGERCVTYLFINGDIACDWFNVCQPAVPPKFPLAFAGMQYISKLVVETLFNSNNLYYTAVVVVGFSLLMFFEVNMRALCLMLKAPASTY